MITSNLNFKAQGPYAYQPSNEFSKARLSVPLPKGANGKRINTVQDKIHGASSKISIFDANSVTENHPDFVIGAKNIDIKASRY